MSFARITDSMMNYGFLSSLQGSLTKQYKLQEQMADGKTVHRASDDPVRVVRSLQYRSAVVQNDQFISNVKDAQSWMEVTDKAVNDLSSLMASAKELVVRAIAPNPEIGYEAAAKELDGLINQMVSVANTKIGDRYIFAGQMDKTQPFERLQLADPQERSNLTLDKVVYYGDNRKISMIAQAGEVNPFRDSVNLTGLDVFGRTEPNGTNYAQATTDVFNRLIRVKEELERKTTASKTNSQGGVIDIDGHYTGSQEYQDYAVKIDALRVKIGQYSQVTAAATTALSGSLKLEYRGQTDNMAKYSAAGQNVQVTVDSLKMDSTVIVDPTQEAGALSIESSDRAAAVPASGAFRTRIDSVQTAVGSISASNALGGALNVTYNGFGNAAGDPVLHFPPYDLAKNAPLNLEVKIDGVTAGEATQALYRTGPADPWLAATYDPVQKTFVLDNAANNIGIQFTVGTDAQNAVGDTYTVPLKSTGKVMKMSFSTDSGVSWNAAAPNAEKDPIRFSAPNAVTGYGGDLFLNVQQNENNQMGDSYQVTQLSATGEIASISYSISGVADPNPVYRDNDGLFKIGDTGFYASITTKNENNGGDVYTLSDLSTNGEVAAVSYSLDEGDTWTRAAEEPVTKLNNAAAGDMTIGGNYSGLPAYEDVKVTVKAWQVQPATVEKKASGGDLHIAYAGSGPVPSPPVAPANWLRIDSVDGSNGRVTGLSYFDPADSLWHAATTQSSQGATVFSLGGTYSDMSVSIEDNTANAALDTYNITGPTLDTTSPGLVSYTLTPAPDLNNKLTESAEVWSMKGANSSSTKSGFLLADGLTVDIAATASNTLSQNYSFRAPPRFDLAYGIEASIAPNAKNEVKDAYTFHMPQSSEGPDHNPPDQAVGPDLDWLSAKGLADIDSSHDQILKAVVEVGTRASMYEMTANRLEANGLSLTTVLANNEDLDMAKAIIDLKTAENSYKASLSFGSRILPTSLVDFLR